MTHAPTVAQLKGARGGRPLQDLPRPGTKIRRVYDLLAAAPGRWVPIDPCGAGFQRHSELAATIAYLTDSYGLDVRFRASGKHGVPSSYMMAGAWIGRVYLDYVVDPSLLDSTRSGESA
jgi:hypothetical protein